MTYAMNADKINNKKEIICTTVLKNNVLLGTGVRTLTSKLDL